MSAAIQPFNKKMYDRILVGGVIIIIVSFSIYYFIKYKEWKSYMSKLKFPPWPSRCPDYWKVEGDKKCRNCHNIGLCKRYDGTANSNIMDFSDPIFKGKKGDYYKCSWAKKCHVPWEGIDQLCL